MTNNLVYEVVHSSVELKSVQDYIEDVNSPAHKYIDNPEKFLNVRNKEGRTNREVIEATYITNAEKRQYVGKSASEMILKVGTRLAIEQEMVDRVGLLTQGLEVVSNDVPAFKAKMLAQLESEVDYRTVQQLKPIDGKRILGTTKELYPDMTVWIWCRSLASQENNYEGAIFNLTPFLMKCSTSVARNGGNWQITLPPLVCASNDKGQWVIKKKSLQFYKDKKRTSIQGTGFVSEDSLFDASDPKNPLVRNQMLFHNIIGTNDLIFIRFETLQMEAEVRVDDEKNLFISKERLPNRAYDMIGLVDRNNISVNSSSNDVSIEITGTDISKLFIDDGTYFFSLELSQGMIGGPGSRGSRDALTLRLASDQALQYLSLYFNNSIEKVFEFVINQLSNIKVVPDSLFDAYGDRRNTRFVRRTDDEVFSKLDQQVRDLSETTTNNILEIRKKAGLQEPTVAGEQQKGREIFIELKRFLQDIRTQKVREVAGNVTISWKDFKYTNQVGVTESIVEGTFPQYFADQLFNVRETRLVPESESLVNNVDQILDIEASKSNYKGEFQKEIAPGIWQIIKLVIDEAVTNRRLVDSSISTANGSLLNFFRKVCQEPFVEYYMDTYGDMYHLIIRKPPTDRSGVMSLLKAQINVEDNTNTSPAIINIAGEDVLSENLFFSDDEAVSWYHLVPQANFTGGTDAVSLAYLPAIHFPEYADIWGSRPLQLCHNYLPMMPKNPNANSLDIAQKQAVEDMKYLIESHAHLPFTRKGVIKTDGDRRIKYGNLIRYLPTGEIFKVDGVRQDWSINENSIERTTVIQVSRGMVEQLIYGIPAKNSNGEIIDGYISYFNIIETNPTYEYKDVTNYVEKRKQVGTKVIEGSGNQTITTSNSTIPSDRILEKGNINTYLLNSYKAEYKSRFIQLINAVNQLGYYVHITSGVRTYNEQKALYAKNQKNAKPGHSKHESGLAIDINLFTKLAPVVKITSKSSAQTWLATNVPQVASTLGIKWGGSAFSNYYDPVHFEIELIGNITPTRTEPIYEITKVPVKGKVLDIGKIFSKFRVNDYVFNFFLRREQFNKQYLSPTQGFYTKDPVSNKVYDNLEEVTVTPTQNSIIFNRPI